MLWLRRTVFGIVLLTLMLLPQVVVAGPSPIIAPDAKPALQAPALKTGTPPANVDAAVSSPPEITGVRYANHMDAVSGISRLRIVLEVSQPVKAEAMVIGAPSPKLVITLIGTAVGKLDGGLSFDGTIAEQASAYMTSGGDTRMVIDVPLMLEEQDYRLFTLPGDAKANRPFRVVVDINRKVPVFDYKFTPGIKNKVIVLDPGHGGSDPGAIGPNRSQEKTITLAVALKTKTLLEKAGAKVIMTRQDDRDVFGPGATAADELKARTTIANNRKADAFISIHIDAFRDPAAGGTSTYFYQKTPYDSMLAQNLQASLQRASGLRDRGINSANFYVIKRTIMPAALLELGFITNPNEEKLLNTPEFQQRMAQAIVQGLDCFFTQAAR
ncbi:MAG: N-acetylmuramoyl-L-alanine amidase [Negativicutes bacterium]|nr:N-acetylmuramoyl-L-alanine amidase [Negativicutes bacterium]